MAREEVPVEAVARAESEAATCGVPLPEDGVLATMAVIASTTAGSMMGEEELRREAESAVVRGVAPLPPSARALRAEVADTWKENFTKATRLLEWAQTERSNTPVGAAGTMSLVLLAGYVVEFVHWSHGAPKTTGSQVVQVVKLDSSQRVIYSVPAVRPLRAIDSYHIILPSTGTVHRKVSTALRPRISDEVMNLYRLWVASAPELGVGEHCDWCTMPTVESVCKCPLCMLCYHKSCVRRAKLQLPLPAVHGSRLPAQLCASSVCDLCESNCTVERQSAC